MNTQTLIPLYRLIKSIGVNVKLMIKYWRIKLTVAVPKDFKKDIPIIINNYNQLDYLARLIDALEERGYSNIIILDNASTYPPLLEYYNNTRHRVIELGDNFGYLALWKSGVYKEFNNKFFVYTDPDVLPIEDCPDNFLEEFFKIMQKYPLSSKVGFSLKIDDLPSCFQQRDKVIDWESQFWTKKIGQNLYSARVDTTFALYRPFTKYGSTPYEHHIRVGYPYVLRHLPWYQDSNNLSENMKYYINACKKSTHWSKQMNKS